MWTVKYENGNAVVKGLTDFTVDRVFDCGQCFRFEINGSKAVGVAKGKLLELTQTDDGIIIENCTDEDFEGVWKHYLALDADYASINDRFISGNDAVMSRAAECSRGIRILRQDGWEALCSFIISQNNNIPRIKKIIDALCRSYGEPFIVNGKEYYTFPSAERLAALSVDEIFALRVGFRAAYISDAAKKVASGETDLTLIESMPTPDALECLCKIKGVGPKVASCALLFGFDKGDCFPVDVWVKRVLAKYYPDGFDHTALGENAGIAQQYLFYYERYEQAGKQ